MGFYAGEKFEMMYKNVVLDDKTKIDRDIAKLVFEDFQFPFFYWDWEKKPGQRSAQLRIWDIRGWDIM